jgi:hypothetical protein
MGKKTQMNRRETKKQVADKSQTLAFTIKRYWCA